MFQGTGSNVGKSLMVAGLCRAYSQRGMKVSPFKPQNMSNNAAVTADRGEIGRAQALQARAAGLQPVTDMNPVLLKPETERGAQVVVKGKRVATMSARDYANYKAGLMDTVLESHQRLLDSFDIVLIEGAGSPAEINLRKNDIANMGFSSNANVPVIMVGDIDRGGVIAQLVGTHSILPDSDRNLIKAFLVNKFRGDPSLFDSGLEEIINRTGWLSLGVVPWFASASKLPAEDIMDLDSSESGAFRIAVPQLSRISNFDDLDPLLQEPEVNLEIIEPGQPLPGDAKLIILPGSKATTADLEHFRNQGWDIDLQAHVRRGGCVLGICGGYQMLGKAIIDRDGIEGSPGEFKGLGLLDVVTKMTPFKRLESVQARHIKSGAAIQAYEMRKGETAGPDCECTWIKIDGKGHGGQSADRKILGCYLHGMFASDSFRKSFLAEIGINAGSVHYESLVEETLDSLAEHLSHHLDLDQLLEIAESGG